MPGTGFLDGTPYEGARRLSAGDTLLCERLFHSGWHCSVAAVAGTFYHSIKKIPDHESSSVAKGCRAMDSSET